MNSAGASSLVKVGTTSYRLQVFIKDSTSASDAGLTGLAFGTAGLTAAYFRDGDTAATPIALVTAAVGTWTSSGFIVCDAANFPGLYEIGIPNAVLANKGAVKIVLQGAANMMTTIINLQVVAFDPNDGNALGLVDVGEILTQTNLLEFTGAGYVKSAPQTSVAVSGTVVVSGYSTGQDPGSLVLAVAANKLTTDTSGRVILQPSGLDPVVIETSINARQALALGLSALVGVFAGAPGTSVTIAAANAPSVPRIACITDGAGNRTAVTLTPPA